MRFDLQSSTDVAVHAIFDPAAMLHVINNPKLQHIDEGVLASDVERGNVLLYSCSSDGHVRFRVFVNQEPGEDVLALAPSRKEGVLMRLPSGMLTATGMEYLCRPDEKPIAPAEFEAVYDWMGSNAEVEPGNYLLDAFTTPGGKDDHPLVQRRNRARGCGCAVVALAALGALVAGLADWVDPIHALLAWCILSIVALLPAVVFDQIAKRTPSIRQQLQEAKELKRRYPFDAVLVLRRLPDDADLATLRGGAFGEAYEGSGWRNRFERAGGGLE